MSFDPDRSYAVAFCLTVMTPGNLGLGILHRIPRGLLRGFYALAESVPVGAFRNTPSACGGDRNFEDFASLLAK